MSLKSVRESGSKLWLDSIDPDYLKQNLAWGVTGATSNPIIIAGLIKSGRFDRELDRLAEEDLSDQEIAWQLTDEIVTQAQQQLLPIWQESKGNDGYVSFELDPLLEDPLLGPAHHERVAAYIEQGRYWSAGQDNRMIKVPATPAGLDCLEELVAGGATVNVTLVFTDRQYCAARDAVWRGAQRRDNLANFKSVYSIFVSRVDVYTEKHAPALSASAQGEVGIVNAKRIWSENQRFWQASAPPLDQEIVFASTGTKKPDDPPWKYVEAFAGSDILTNPPATNEAVENSGLTFTRHVHELPSADVLAEIDEKVDFEHLEQTLMEEGIKKFADPQKALLELIAAKRESARSSLNV